MGIIRCSLVFPCFSRLTPLPTVFFRSYSASNSDYVFFSQKATFERISKSDIRVIPDVITKTEEDLLRSYLSGQFDKMKFQEGHWDQVIVGYREKTIGNISELPRFVSGILGRVTKWLLLDGRPLLPIHALELQSTGFIAAHVDSVKFSGGVLAGLSLFSDAVMRLRPARDHVALDCVVDLMLPARSLYVLTGAARYDWTHEIQAGMCCFGLDVAVPLAVSGAAESERVCERARAAGLRVVPRGPRTSLLFRDELPVEDQRRLQASGLSGTVTEDGELLPDPRGGVLERDRPAA